ncbi:methylated-DNA--[protein]-cysteine S-methyltransferase [Myxococcaceae bacterium JPH2]|nr:methylated-DNA--[protein]-cysteine S-methyltransferase [Myxococcaceae bacterium JPH2]
MTRLFSSTLASPVGPLRLFASERGLCAIYFPNHRRARDLDAHADDAQPVLRETRRQLQEYFARERTAFQLALDPEGTPFQQSVWRALQEIPPGTTWTYAMLARHVGREGAARAVGSANARNPVSIVVPCHRVVGASGKLTGYAGGLATKQWLLEHERGD